MKRIFSLDEVTKVVGELLIPCLGTKRIFAFKGPLGAGKTTVIKEFFRQVGIKEVVTSPTFAYVKRYEVDGKIFNHFDLYRVDSLATFLELGFDEYLYDERSFVVIEWPEVVEELLLDSAVKDRVCVVVLDYLKGDLERREIKLIK